MKAIEIKQITSVRMTGNYKPRTHSGLALDLGRCFPTTKAQVKKFIAIGRGLDVLGMADVELVEALLSKHGYEGSYQYTKSKTFVRLINNQDFCEALKKEYL